MYSHKDRLRIISGKNASLSRSNNRGSSRRSNSHLMENEQSTYRISSHSDDEVISKDNRRPVYANVPPDRDEPDGSESPEYAPEKRERTAKSMDRLPTNSRPATMKSNGSKHYLNMHNPNSQLALNIHKSQSLRALKASEPNKVLMKSSIQQEYHDKAVQQLYRGISHGKARKPCLIATAMFVVFVVFFLVGLVVIGLTYLYQNIMPTLDIGVGVGPCFVAVSFVFLGVGIKFIYDAHKLSRKERRLIGYKSYNRNYVGIKSNNHNPQRQREKIQSGTASNNAITRVPNKLKPVHYKNHSTLNKASTLTRTEKSSNA